MDDIAKEIREKLGMPEPTDDEREERHRRYESARSAKICARCGGPIGDTVYISRSMSRAFIGWSYSRIAVCENCKPKWDSAEPRPCETCGRVVRDPHRRWYSLHTFCSEQCRKAHEVIQQRLQRHAARKEIECPSCGKRFTPKRADTKTCSPACRQRLHRLRHR